MNLKENEFIVIKLDKPNKNGRVYPTEVIEKAIENVQATINEKRFLGELFPENFNINYSGINLSNVSHIVEGLTIKDNNLIAELRPLHTPRGEILKDLLERKEVGFRTRGLGQMDDSKVITSYELISIDALPIKNCA